MLKKLFNEDIAKIINCKIALNDLNEIRLRKDKPIVVFIKNQPYYICESGLCCDVSNALYCTKTMIEDIVYRASDCSVYSVNEQIKNGYLILENGVRIGLCGDVVQEDGKIKTITNFSSLNIRIPHKIRNSCTSIFDDLIAENNIYNTLILSPPGAGKTTFIRDFVYQLSKHNYCLNVAVVDERGEIAMQTKEGDMLGNFCDVISYTDKKNGFNTVIRSMNPYVIVTDEIGNDEDANVLVNAMNSGVKVMATVHASSLEELRRKEFFKNLPEHYFKRYVVLSCKNGPGTIEGVYNEKFSRIYKW